VAGEVAKLARSMDSGVVLGIAWEWRHGIGVLVGIPIHRS